MAANYTSGDITAQLIRDSKNCWGCDNKMLGIFSYCKRTKCISCGGKSCESPEELLKRLQIVNSTRRI